MRFAAASFTSADEGYRQDFEFTSRGAFTSTVLPMGAPIAGVVICPSLFIDLYHHYRLEVLFARRLARLGVAVCRFHYRGTGISHGDANEMTWESLLEDAADSRMAIARHIAPDVPVGVMGARFGSLIALTLGAGKPEMPLALLAPIPAAATYARDLHRVERVARITDPDGHVADAMATRMPADLAARGAELSIEAISGRGVGDVLVVRTGRGSASADDERAVDALRTVATSVDVRHHVDEDGWWARARLAPAGPMDRMLLLDDTAEWLNRALEKASRP